MVRAPGRRREGAWGIPTHVGYKPRRNLPPKPLQMITRGEWDAHPPPPDNPGPRLELPIRHIRYTFTRTPPCNDVPECIPRVQEMQRDAMSQGLPDVMFNFLVGSDGIIYEGRGWDYNCAKADDFFVDSPGPSLTIAYIGTYEDTVVPWKMGHAGEHIRKWALHHNLLVKEHEITPSLACFKEGEENIDHLAEAVAKLGLDRPQEEQPFSSRPPVKDRFSEDKDEEEEGDEGEEDEDEKDEDEEDEDEEDEEDEDEDDEDEDDEDEDEDEEDEDEEDEDEDYEDEDDEDEDEEDEDDEDEDEEDEDDSVEGDYDERESNASSYDGGDVGTDEDTSVSSDEDDSFDDSDDSDEGSDDDSDDNSG